MKLFDLALADEALRPSPFCWVAKFALLHKGLDFETVPLRFAEKENYPDTDHAKVPVLIAEDETICDSDAIVSWLDESYPDNPLTRSSGEKAASDFFRAWRGPALMAPLAPHLMIKIWALAHEDDKAYFRSAREERFGVTLEELAAKADGRETIENAMKTLAGPLTRHRFLGGDSANLCDYLVFAPLMWKRVVTAETLYEPPQSVEAWMERMLDLYDGYARKAATAS